MVPSFAAMKSLRRVLLLVGIVAIVGYGGAMVWLVSQETRLVFEAGRPIGDLRPAAPFEEVWVDRAHESAAAPLDHADRDRLGVAAVGALPARQRLERGDAG